MNTNIKLWKFHWDVGRMGDLEGLFLATEEDVKSLIGKTVWFGEVLGKHSDIYGDISPRDIKELHVEPATISDLAQHGPTLSGHNPFDYYEEEEDDDGEEE